MTIQEPAEESKGLSVAEARGAVLASNQLESFEGPLFLADNESEWLPYYIGRYNPEAHPLMAMVIVQRKGQQPRKIVISWDEYAEIIGDDDEKNDREREWNDKRARKPMAIFGAEVERHALRVVFADILEPLTAALPPVMLQPETKAAEPERDWFADLAATTSKPEIDALFEEARAAKALKSAELHEAFTRRLRDVLASPKAEAWSEPEQPAPTLGVVPSPAQVAAKAKPLVVATPKRPAGGRPQGQRRRGSR